MSGSDVASASVRPERSSAERLHWRQDNEGSWFASFGGRVYHVHGALSGSEILWAAGSDGAEDDWVRCQTAADGLNHCQNLHAQRATSAQVARPMTHARLLTSAKLLYAHAVHGLPDGTNVPGWLADCGKDIDASAVADDGLAPAAQAALSVLGDIDCDGSITGGAPDAWERVSVARVMLRAALSALENSPAGLADAYSKAPSRAAMPKEGDTHG